MERRMYERTDKMPMSDLKPSDILLQAGSADHPIPIWGVGAAGDADRPNLSDSQQAWLDATGFKGKAKKVQLVPAANGTIEAVLFGLEGAKSGDPAGPPTLLTGSLATSLPAGTYSFAGSLSRNEHAAIAWGLGGTVSIATNHRTQPSTPRGSNSHRASTAIAYYP